MPGYHSNLFGYCMDGIGSVFVLALGLIFSLVGGSLLAILIAGHGVNDMTAFAAMIWFGGVMVGAMQVWGLLSYTLIAFEAIALFRASSHRWLILLTILLMQFCETSRMLFYAQDSRAWLQAIAITGVVALPILNIVLYRYFERTPKSTEAPYTDCRSCGYNLTGTLAAKGTSCPECGEPVSQYQHVRSIADQRKPG